MNIRMERHHTRGLVVDSFDEENAGWLAIGIIAALLFLGFMWILYQIYRTYDCNKVPSKINAPSTRPNLPVAETRSESDAGESGLASFLQNQRVVPDDTSEMSQSDVWSFSLKSFPGRATPMPYYETESQPDVECDDVSLYTNDEPSLPARIVVEPEMPRSLLRNNKRVEI